MSTQPERNPQAGRGPAAPSKPPASLLTVPIFRDQKDRRRHNGSPHPADQTPVGTSAVIEQLNACGPAPQHEPAAAPQSDDAPAAAETAESPERADESQAADTAAPETRSTDETEAPSEPAPEPFALDDTPLIDAGSDTAAPETPAPDADDPTQTVDDADATAEEQAVPAEAAAAPDAAPEPETEAESPARAAAPRRARRFGLGASRNRPVEAKRTGPAEKSFRDLKQYWRWLSHADFPDVDKLDPSLIARNWPYTMLIRVPDDGLLDIVRVFTPNEATDTGGGTASGHPFAGDRMSQISTWVLDLARQAAAERRATEARERFQLDVGSKTFAATLLPCVSAADSAAYVLLNVREA